MSMIIIGCWLDPGADAAGLSCCALGQHAGADILATGRLYYYFLNKFVPEVTVYQE